MFGTLYIVGTPIGNYGDITERAKEVLSSVDIIAAEDTRTTQNLLRHYNISKKLISNHKFNERQQQNYLTGELLAGKNVAVVSDAGMPCISDPGGVLVQAAVDAGIPVRGICGASAPITALSVSGFFFTRFAFYGFLPKAAKEIKKLFQESLQSGISTNVFFESPKRIVRTMDLLAEEIPVARVCLCNDLTKLYERLYRGSPAEVVAELRNNASAEKGEYTLVVHHRIEKMPAWSDNNNTPFSLEAQLVEHMVRHQCSAKEAVAALSVQGVAQKRELYQASLRLKKVLPFGREGSTEDDANV